MGYDTNLDECFKTWEHRSKSGNLYVGLYRYNGGSIKLGIYDRILPNGDKLILNKKGRFTIEEIEFLESKMPEIWKEIAKHK